MANLHITELVALSSGDQDSNVTGLPGDGVATTQVVAIGAGSLASAAFNATTQWLKITAGAACSIAFGTAPTAVAGGVFLAAGETVYCRVPIGYAYKVAVIQDAL